MSTMRRCSERTYGRSAPITGLPCGGRVVMEDGQGKPWCAMHRPGAAEARRKAADEKWRARMAREREAAERHRAAVNATGRKAAAFDEIAALARTRGTDVTLARAVRAVIHRVEAER